MKRILNGGVILSTMRKLRTWAIFESVFSLLGVLFLMVSLFSLTDLMSLAGGAKIAVPFSGPDAACWLPMISIVGALGMTISAFNYLHKRSDSDFVLALPHTRVEAYFSRIAAVVIMTAMVVATTGIVLLLLDVILPWITIDLGGLAMVLLNCVVGALLTSAATAIAMAVTGTAFSGLIVTAIIIYLPKTVFGLFTGSVHAALSSELIVERTVFSLSVDYNLASGWMSGECLSSGWSTLYSLLLAAVYLFVGVVLYRRRRAELAGVSAPSKKMQMIFRILLGFFMFTVLTSLLFILIFSGSNSLSMIFLPILIVLFVGAAVLYFVYEYVTTKSGKNVLRAIPGLGVVILLSGLMFGGMTLMYHNELNFCPSLTELKSVNFISPYSAESEKDYGYYTLGEYLTRDIEQYKIEDDVCKWTALAKLSDGIENFKASRSTDLYSLDFETLDNYLYLSGSLRLIGFDAASGYKERGLYFDEKDQELLDRFFDQAVDALYGDVTSIELSEKDFDSTDSYLSSLSNSEYQNSIRSAIEELRGISVREWIEREREHDRKGSHPTGEFSLYLYPDGRSSSTSVFGSGEKYVEIPVAPETLPKTYEKFAGKFIDAAMPDGEITDTVLMTEEELAHLEDEIWMCYDCYFQVGGEKKESFPMLYDEKTFEYLKKHASLTDDGSGIKFVLLMADDDDDRAAYYFDPKFRYVEKYFYVNGYSDEDFGRETGYFFELES